MWCLIRTEKISWADHVGNEVLHEVMEDRDIVHRIKGKNANWIGHILRRNCLLKPVIEHEIEGGIEGVGR